MSNQHYRTHESVNNAINPYSALSPAKFSEELYLSYNKLQNLSRRARYLCHDDPRNKDSNAFLTHETHFEKAIYHLDKLLDYIQQEYGVKFEIVELPVKRTDLLYFRKQY